MIIIRYGNTYGLVLFGLSFFVVFFLKNKRKKRNTTISPGGGGEGERETERETEREKEIVRLTPLGSFCFSSDSF